MGNLTLSSDEIFSLVQKCGKGDVPALKQFFELYSQDIYNFPIRVFHLSEDDASDFYIYAFERLKSGKRFHSFVGKSSFKTWFYSVLRNLLIDWQRTKRELKITSLNKIGKDGVEYSTIEDEPDHRIDKQKEAEEISEHFRDVLKDVKIESRVIFKLSFIYYLHLDSLEISHLSEKSGLPWEDLQIEILRLRESLSEREEENIQMEDKITSLYLKILDLKSQIEKLGKASDPDSLRNLERIHHSLRKKYEQRKKLIEKKRKGHFLVRTPYKDIAKLLGISEGGVSVSLIRIIEKMQKLALPMLGS